MRTTTKATALAGTTALLATLGIAGATAPAAAVTTTHEAYVFTSDRDGDEEIYRQQADGTVQRLTRNRTVDHSPRWSPDGTRIAYVSQRGGDDEIVVMDADGRNKRQLTHNDALDGVPSWSPDGQRIAFVSTRDGGEAEVYVMRADGRVERRTTVTAPYVTDHQPTWTPDGSALLFASDREGIHDVELFRMRPDGGDVRALTSTGEASDENSPDVSPDGRLVVLSSNRSGDHDLYVMATDGSQLRRLGGTAGLDDVFPRWTADGQRIVFWTFAPADGSDSEAVWSIDADGTDLRRLTTSTADDSQPDPDPRG